MHPTLASLEETYADLEVEIEAQRKKIVALQKEVDEFKEHVNRVWADTYAGAAPAPSMEAIKYRVLNLAEDRNCWLFNARVANNKLNEIERERNAAKEKMEEKGS